MLLVYRWVTRNLLLISPLYAISNKISNHILNLHLLCVLENTTCTELHVALFKSWTFWANVWALSTVKTQSADMYIHLEMNINAKSHTIKYKYCNYMDQIQLFCMTSLPILQSFVAIYKTIKGFISKRFVGTV